MLKESTLLLTDLFFKQTKYLNVLFKSQKTSGLACFLNNIIDLSLSHVTECSRLDEPYHAFSPILTSFDKSEKFRAVIYFNFGVLLQK